MKMDQQRTTDSLRRVQSFMGTHADVLGTLAGSEGKKQIDDAVTAIAIHDTAQGSADRFLAGQMGSQQALAKELITSHMLPIAKFARAKLRGAPDFASLTQPVSFRSPNALLRNARSMVSAAANHADVLTAGGFPADTVAQLTASANQLESVVNARIASKDQRVQATKGIEESLKLGRDGVKMLDALITKHFGKDKVLLTGWRSASRVNAKPGVVRSTTTVPATTPATPATTPAATPAAAVPVPVTR